MEVNILFFGSLAEIAGTRQMPIDEVENTTDVRRKLESRFPRLKNKTYRISVNRRLAEDNVEFSGGEEVALLPPFAGG